MQTGKPVTSEPVCKAMSPPPYTRVAATSPSANAQKIRNHTDVFSLPPLVIKSITREPLSEEVTKNIIPAITTNRILKQDKGKYSNKLNKAVVIFSFTAAVIPPSPKSSIWNAVLPKIEIHKTLTAEGASTTPMSNSFMVLPLEIRAINKLTKGAQANHHPQ